MHPNKQFLAHLVVHMPLCLHDLFRIAHPLHSNWGGEGTVTWGMFPRGSEDTAAHRRLLCKRGRGYPPPPPSFRNKRLQPPGRMPSFAAPPFSDQGCFGSKNVSLPMPPDTVQSLAGGGHQDEPGTGPSARGVTGLTMGPDALSLPRLQCNGGRWVSEGAGATAASPARCGVDVWCCWTDCRLVPPSLSHVCLKH